MNRVAIMLAILTLTACEPTQGATAHNIAVELPDNSYWRLSYLLDSDLEAECDPEKRKAHPWVAVQMQKRQGEQTYTITSLDKTSPDRPITDEPLGELRFDPQGSSELLFSGLPLPVVLNADGTALTAYRELPLCTVIYAERYEGPQICAVMTDEEEASLQRAVTAAVADDTVLQSYLTFWEENLAKFSGEWSGGVGIFDWNGSQWVLSESASTLVFRFADGASIAVSPERDSLRVVHPAWQFNADLSYSDQESFNLDDRWIAAHTDDFGYDKFSATVPFGGIRSFDGGDGRREGMNIAVGGHSFSILTGPGEHRVQYDETTKSYVKLGINESETCPGTTERLFRLMPDTEALLRRDAVAHVLAFLRP